MPCSSSCGARRAPPVAPRRPAPPFGRPIMAGRRPIMAGHRPIMAGVTLLRQASPCVACATLFWQAFALLWQVPTYYGRRRPMMAGVALLWQAHLPVDAQVAVRVPRREERGHLGGGAQGEAEG
eukprot:2379564-Prymnesium_polylepis.1